MGYRYGGRAKGTPNKKTLSLIEKCEAVGIDVFETMLESLQQAEDPYKRFEMAAKIAEYIYPKRKAIELSNGENGFKLVIEDYSSIKKLKNE